MLDGKISRRTHLAMLGAGTGLLFSGGKAGGHGAWAQASAAEAADRVRRMKWWHEAKFGMFIHWGL